MKTLASILLGALTTVSFSTLSAPESYGILFLDRSGSMMTLRPDKQSRCAYSKQQAISKATKFFLDSSINGQKLNVKTFSSGGQIQSITNGFVDFTGAFMALQQLDGEGCRGATALAEAMCDGADELRTNFSVEASRGALLRVYGSSDGDENASPVTHCGGANWQANVTAKYLMELPQVQFNATIYTGTVQSIAMSDKLNAAIANDLPAYAMSPNTYTKNVPTFDFLKQLAAQTGGTVEEVSDSDGGDPGEW
ncbi:MULTISPECIES: VWA domain-containing protein [Pseudoalteromonas]|uniref:VWA domain-containing protein n=1 Tax=Pseudoalteromonas obscura TaxID=3048491 RepID=A0ABT7ENS0_9GAMM|nr:MULTISPECIES: VWA domain-containing protein [Pseudoalteromonas]MBQ4835260.1 VWA domain-containing protein [Pseudoalteromonas luteoviolacea]MDK2596658.1 VWA domain-containing protein [Pseudoalteromonas sp. P94(2023)]